MGLFSQRSMRQGVEILELKRSNFTTRFQVKLLEYETIKFIKIFTVNEYHSVCKLMP